MISAAIKARLEAFLRFADLHLERGNVDAAREALDDAHRLLAASGLDEEVEW